MQNTYKIAPDELQSLDKDPVITYSIKENPYKANVEIEGKERVLAPDMAGLYLAKGKKHSGGGMDVYLPDKSFVFSDDTKLSLDENDHELYELKKGGNFNKTNNTPSKVLKRNVDEKHYNKMIQILSDPKSDDYSKRTAALMLNKYEEALGKVAFIQEGKKDFPSGIPDFAANTAPVYETKLKTQIDEQKQYMKQGGYRLPKAEYGDYIDDFTDPYRKSHTPQGGITPTGRSSFYNRGPEYLQSWEKLIPGITNMDNKKAQSLIYDYTLKNDPNVISNMWKDAGLTNQGKKYPNLVNMTDKDSHGKPLYTFNNTSLDPTKLGQLKDAYVDGMFGYRQLEASNIPTLLKDPHNPLTPNFPTDNSAPVGAPEYKPLGDIPDRRKPINWEFNKYQKQDMMFDGLQWASARQEFPYRSQVQSPLVELERVNPQAALNQVDNSVNNAYRNSRAINPYLAAGSNQQAFGQGLDSKAQIQSQYDNQNVQIANQQNLTNNQIQTQDQRTNIGADQQYWKESVEGRKNFDNLRDFAFNNFRNTRNHAIEQNQQLAYGMAAYGDYQPFEYDFKTGQYNLTGRASILDQNGNSKADFTQGLIDRISKSNISEDKKLELLTKLGVSKQLTLPQHKKGGAIYNRNPYRG